MRVIRVTLGRVSVESRYINKKLENKNRERARVSGYLLPYTASLHSLLLLRHHVLCSDGDCARATAIIIPLFDDYGVRCNYPPILR